MIKKEETDKRRTDNGKKYDIRERIFDMVLRIIEISEMLPRSNTNELFTTRLVRSGTSIGANMEEADGAISKQDFTNKVVLARKEALETRYWLRIIKEKYIREDELNDDINEVQQIIYILSAIIKKTKTRT